MDLSRETKDKVTIDCSPEEVAFLCNTINETLEAIQAWEFQTRTGESVDRAREILAQLQMILNQSQAK